MTAPVRILFIGGKRHNVPENRLLCEWEQYEQDSSQLRRGTISFPKDKPFHIILCFNDFIGHDGSNGFRSKAKMLGIPFVGASGGFTKLLEAAKNAGHDLYPFVKTDRPQVAPKPPTERIPSTPIIEWAKSIPRQAQARIVKNGIRVWVIPNRGGGESVLLKGKLLDDAVNYVKKHGLGSGARGGLTPKEALKVVRHMEKQYEFAKRGITLTHTTVTRNVGVILGTLTTKVKKAVLGKFAKGKKAVKKAAAKASDLIKKKQEESLSPEEREARAAAKRKVEEEINGKVEPLARPRSSSPSSSPDMDIIELLSADIARSIEFMLKKHDVLTEKIVELNRENAGFIEAITRIEEERDRLRDEVTSLQDEVKKWKRMAIE
jgi:hypothetical protein